MHDLYNDSFCSHNQPQRVYITRNRCHVLYALLECFKYITDVS